ncbi:hypothetical protein [Halorarius litoreus]|uniref:hypothetical protein n=1 Tax=Halorarius litoreus TaxID=2962676 RepID=UPI0020CBAF0A|nr:hypothetical protein [Halorarius litoreus]
MLTHEAEIADELLTTTLPILEDSGYIEVDDATNTVHRGPNFEEIEAVLELFDDEADDVYRDWP